MPKKADNLTDFHLGVTNARGAIWELGQIHHDGRLTLDKAAIRTFTVEEATRLSLFLNEIQETLGKMRKVKKSTS